MIFTESDAVTRRCVHGHDAGPCIGTQCMAFRRFEPARAEHWDKIVPAPDDIAKRYREGYREDPNHKGGMMKKTCDARPATFYCGLAGRP